MSILKKLANTGIPLSSIQRMRLFSYSIVFIAILITVRSSAASAASDAFSITQFPTTYTDPDNPYKNQPFNNSLVTIALRTQRDLASEIPINRVLWPAINLTTAWFESTNFSLARQTSVPNLLLAGYRRLIMDIYWDDSTGSWGLCPIRFSQSETPMPTQTISDMSTSTQYGSDNAFTITSSSPIAAAAQQKRDTAIQNDFSQNNYTCATSNISTVLGAINNTYLAITDPKRIDMVFIIFNLHVINAPSLNTSSQNPLVLSEELNKIFQRELYTPSQLAIDRANLSASFGTGNTSSSPYFSVGEGSNGSVATSNGWPHFSYLNQINSRVLVGIGDNYLSASSSYNITADYEVIFKAEDLNGTAAGTYSFNLWPSTMNCSVPAEGVIMVSSETNINESLLDGNEAKGWTAVPWGWNYMNDANSNGFNYWEVTNMSACGYSPLSEIHSQYLYDNILGTIWSWDVNQPSFGSNLAANQSNSGHCAAIQAFNGRWNVQDCTFDFPVACQSIQDPENWTITTQRTNYEQAQYICPSGYEFGVPRTSQQNLLLYAAINSSSIKSELYWINFNSLPASDCWVVGLVACPYDVTKTYLHSLITTSLIAGIIILVLCVAFAWYKCRMISRGNKIRRRRDEVKARTEKQEFVTVPA